MPDEPSLVVLPFANLNDDPKQDYFAHGITNDLITELSKVSGLFVIARNSSFSYQDKPAKIAQVAEELGVRYVLEGSVQRAGDRVRINAQLVDALSGGHVWAERTCDLGQFGVRSFVIPWAKLRWLFEKWPASKARQKAMPCLSNSGSRPRLQLKPFETSSKKGSQGDAR